MFSNNKNNIIWNTKHQKGLSYHDLTNKRRYKLLDESIFFFFCSSVRLLKWECIQTGDNNFCPVMFTILSMSLHYYADSSSWQGTLYFPLVCCLSAFASFVLFLICFDTKICPIRQISLNHNAVSERNVHLSKLSITVMSHSLHKEFFVFLLLKKKSSTKTFLKVNYYMIITIARLLRSKYVSINVI